VASGGGAEVRRKWEKIMKTFCASNFVGEYIFEPVYQYNNMNTFCRARGPDRCGMVCPVVKRDFGH